MKYLKFLNIVFWIFFIFAVIFALWYIFGNSPTLENSLLILILLMTFNNYKETIKNRYTIKNLEVRLNKIENK